MLEQLKNLGKLNLDDWYNTFLGLEKRQKFLVSLVIIFLFFLTLWLPTRILSTKLSDVRDDYQTRRKDAERLRKILDDYAALQKSLGQSVPTNEDDLSGLIYNKAELFGIPKKKVNLKSIKLAENELFEQDGKDVDIKSVPFDQLMRLIHAIETHTEFPVVVKKLVLKVDRKNRQIINQASFSVATIKARKT